MTPQNGAGGEDFEGISAVLFFPLTPEGGVNMGSFSDGQLHTVASVVDGSAVTQSEVMDSFIQWLWWWTVQQLHRAV